MTTQDFDPAAEELRLAALAAYDVLDTPAERSFDDLATMAARVCDVPVALVTLLDRDRQVFKAHVGTDIPGTPRASSFCSHALGCDEPLVIPDLSSDPRTRDNPLVTGDEHVRFYAGAPLRTPDGHTLGTLCVIDRTPRPAGLTSEQRTTLEALAAQVMSQLELRRAVAERDTALERREADRRLALAEAARLEAMIATQQAVAAATADLDAVFQAIADGALRVVDNADGAVVELREGDDLVYHAVSGALSAHRGIRLPMERTLSGRSIRQERPFLVPDTEVDASLDREIVTRLGIRSMIVVPVTRRGHAVGALKLQSNRPDVFSPRDVVMAQMLAGLAASGFGDVAEVRSKQALRDAENRYRRTFESVTEFGVVVTDLACNVTEWNTGAERIFGWSAEEMVGRNAEVFFTPEDRKAGRTKVEMRQALRDGQAVDERWHLRKDDSRFYASGNMMPLRDDDGTHLGFIKIVRDRTEQHLAGKALEKSEAQLRRAQEAGGVGLFTLDVASGMLTGTPEFSRLYGLEHRESRPATEVEATVLAEDRHHISTDETRRLGDAIRDARYRIRRVDTGEVRWIARKGDMQ
ncbi:MAG: GAF domain-containing protein, partial [Methylobacterium mesophilicum]|nr:GAF domain-containing protein [Methylobacterium mesophilicum]